MEDKELIKKRFSELIRKSENYFTFTDFLGLAEQSALKEVLKETRAEFKLFGGAEGCERVMARFGSPSELGYEETFPIKIIEITPRSEKFSENLTHRDYLGALMNLGIERDVLGDIAVRDKTAYLFLKDDISEYVLSSLSRVRHTDIKLHEVKEVPEGGLYQTKRVRIQSSGERADSVVAKVFSLSRDDSATLFKRGLVFIGGEECESVSKPLKVGNVVSVRGHGRFIYLGYESLSKKGKLNIDVDLFI